MTREEILALSPGRELDELVFKYVMGGKLPKTLRPNFTKFSTDISAAIESAEKVGTFQLTKMGVGNTSRQYRAIVGANKNVAYAETAAEALSKAALLAVMNL